MRTGKKQGLELWEALLLKEVKKHKEKKAGKKPRSLPEAPPKIYLICRLSCKHRDPAAFPEVVEVRVQTISELVARIAADKAARKLGYREDECILLELSKEEG